MLRKNEKIQKGIFEDLVLNTNEPTQLQNGWILSDKKKREQKYQALLKERLALQLFFGFASPNFDNPFSGFESTDSRIRKNVLALKQGDEIYPHNFKIKLFSRSNTIRFQGKQRE